MCFECVLGWVWDSVDGLWMVLGCFVGLVGDGFEMVFGWILAGLGWF